MANVLTLHSPHTADDIEECAREDRQAGLDPTTDVPASWRVIQALTGYEGIVVISKDGASFIGELSDWDEDRCEITVELS
jgi:hypothetical protein